MEDRNKRTTAQCRPSIATGILVVQTLLLGVFNNRHLGDFNTVVASSAVPCADTSSTTYLEARRNTTSNNDTAVGLCSQVNKVEAYLDEWVDYNLGLGFHSLYLYDNSDDNYLKKWAASRRYQGDNIVLRHNPGKRQQIHSFHKCVTEFGANHVYLAFFDVDEFLVLKHHDTVSEFLQQYLPREGGAKGSPEAAGAITINAHWFGTANHTSYSPLPVTKRFQYYEPNDQLKTILKVDAYGGKFNNAHSVELSKTVGPRNWRDTSGFGTYSELGATNLNGPTDVAVIHHYRFLSEREWQYKSCERGHVSLVAKECNDTAPVGTRFDNSAWTTLLQNVPKYRAFEDWVDYNS